MQFRRILFICTGNVCRSPMAEYLLKHDKRVKNLGLTVTSAGLGALVGYPAEPNVRRLLIEQGIDCNPHIARQVNEEIVANADLILIMEIGQRHELVRRFPNCRAKSYLLNHNEQIDIADPYRHSLDVFRDSKNKIDKGLSHWVKKLQLT